MTDTETRCTNQQYGYCESHLGLRHPTSIGDVIGSVADEVDVFDDDGDLVLDAHRGPGFREYAEANFPLTQDTARRKQRELTLETVVDGVTIIKERLAYRYSYLRGGSDRRTTSPIWWNVDSGGFLEDGGWYGEIYTYDWHRWLISTEKSASNPYLTTVELAEVRKSLGLED